MIRTAVLILIMLISSPALGAPAAEKAERDAAMPFARVYDTVTPYQASPGPAELEAKRGWKEIPEDKLDHVFQGDAVLVNDKLVLVLGAHLESAAVLCRTAAGLAPRLTVLPAPAKAATRGRLESVRLLENNPGAVMVSAAYKNADVPGYAVQFRLTAGQPMLEVRPGEGTSRIGISSAAMRHLVVPGFFGDDMVFSAESLPRDLVGLPVESFFLALTDRGSTIVVAAWQPAGQRVWALAGKPQGERQVLGCDIGAVKDKKLWLAFLEGEGLWHERPVGVDDAGKAITLDWRPPLAAKWRADLMGPRGAAQSWDVSDSAAEGPVRIEAGRATVQMPPAPALSSGGKMAAGPLLIYALDRTQATPLTAFTPVDIMRNTLGVGPCQYVLETEGLTSQDNPTPDLVMAWIEKGLRRKKAPDADEVKERLKAMAELAARVDARIKRYADLAADVQAILAKAAPAEAPATQMMGPTLDTIRRAAKAGLGPSPASERAARLAEPIVAAAGKSQITPEFERLAAEIRAIGAAQDKALATCRLTTRWLNEQCGMVAADNPPCADIARKVFERVYPVLNTATPLDPGRGGSSTERRVGAPHPPPDTADAPDGDGGCEAPPPTGARRVRRPAAQGEVVVS